MSIVQTTNLPGDATVGGSVDIGVNAEVHGSVVVEHDLTIRGWLDAPNIKGPNQGIFSTIAELNSAVPNPKAGWFAGVGNSTPFALYKVSNGQWVPTGGTLNVNTDIAEVVTLRTTVGTLTDAVVTANKVIESQKSQIASIVSIIDNMSGEGKLKTITVVSSDTSMGETSGGGKHSVGLSVTIKATPKTGYHFVSWNDGNTNSERTIVISEDATYTATFASNSYSIAASVASGSTGTGSVSGSGSYAHGAEVTLVATPNSSSHFDGWYNGSVLLSASATYKFTATESKSISARFSVNVYSVNVSTNGNNMGTATYTGSRTHGSTLTLIATPSYGYGFDGWVVGGSVVSANSTYSTVITSNLSIIAQFSKRTIVPDYYIGFTDTIDEAEFSGMSASTLSGLATGYDKSVNPKYAGVFTKKTMFIMVKSGLAPSSGKMYQDGGLVTTFTAASFNDNTVFNMVHDAVTIGGTTYNVYGIGSNQFTSDINIEISIK